MAEYTPNYHLYKPNRQDTEQVDLTLKANFEIIDDEIKKRAEETTQVSAVLSTQLNNIQNQVNQAVVGGSIDPEVAQARIGEDGNAHTTLKERLDENERRIHDTGVSVKAFGAVGDGVTDDTLAIQAAIDSVFVSASGRDGAKVSFPAGTYLISDHIKTYANVLLEGVGRRGSTLLLKAGSTCDAMIVREGGTDGYWVQIKDLCLDGQAHLQTVAADGIRLEDSAEALIENVGIRFVRRNGIKITRLSTTSIQPTIKNCVIRADANNHAADAAGIYLDYGSYDGIITENDIGYYKNGYGIRLSYHNGAVLSQNNAWQCKTSYRFEGANRFRMSDCLSDYAQEYGFYYNGCSEFQLSNNQSRWSSCKTPRIYDGIHLYGCEDWILDAMMVLSGDGIQSLDGVGTGQTAYGLALTGGTKNGKINGLFTKNCTGDIFKEAGATNVMKSSEVAI